METFVLLLCVGAVMADPKFYRVGVELEGQKVREDLMLDDKYAIVTVEEAVKVAGCKNTVNLHDFETGYSAFKFIDQATCMVYKGKRSYEQVAAKLTKDRYGQKTLLREEVLSKASGKVISNQKLGELAGERIRTFCEDYDAVMFDVLKGDKRDHAADDRLRPAGDSAFSVL